MTRAGCLQYGTNVLGNDISNTTRTVTDTAYGCQKLCDQEERCLFWTWSDASTEEPYRRTCWLKTSDTGRRAQNQHVSGTKNCQVFLRGRWSRPLRGMYFLTCRFTTASIFLEVT
jgi:hypothetical protein